MLKKSSCYLVYYRAPFCDEPELLCVCPTQTDVSKAMFFYQNAYPDLYPSISRFETSVADYITFGGKVNE